MLALALTLLVSATPRHLAVAPARSDAEIGDLERAVRDALRTALPKATVQTHDDLAAAALAGIELGHATAADADRLCALACAYGEDGLVTAERLELGGRARLRLVIYRPGRPSPLAEVSVPMEGEAAAATSAVKLLLAKL